MDTSEPTSLPRRRFLVGSAGLAASAGVASLGMNSLALASKVERKLPEYVSWKKPQALIVHGPATIETARSAYGTGVITPNDIFFIRNNLTAPNESIVADRDGWEVHFDGVRNPRSFTVGELKRLGVTTVTTVVQCSGNGRAFFEHEPSGTQWKVGASGCAVWSGVPVKAVVAALGGVANGAKYMTSTGGEEIPQGIDPNSVMVERSVPVEAMEDAILAWEMNGEPVPLAHGGPLRVIVPGYTGVNNVKYVKKVAFTENQSPARIQASSYRLSPLGERGNPGFDSVWEMNVKSWINSPNDESGKLSAGKVQIHGVAFGGMHAASKVEVSVDGGKSWRQANFIGPDMGRYAWRQFVLEAELPPGEHVLMSRATDTSGATQPEAREENERGYLNNSWRDHAVRVTVV